MKLTTILRSAFGLLLAIGLLWAQQPSLPVVDLQGAAAPVANCKVGQRYFCTGCTPGQNAYACTAEPNTWSLQGGAGESPAGPAGPMGPPGPAGADGAPGEPGYSPNTLQAGGRVAWTSGLNFIVSAATYLIANGSYSSPETSLTLSAADPANPRIDVIAVTTAGTAIVIEGTAAADPAKPTVDLATQLELTWIHIAAGAAVPTDVVLSDVYHENVEWATSRSGVTITLDSPNNPRTGAVCVEFTDSVTSNYAQFTAPAPFDPATRNTMVFYIRSKAAWAPTRSLQIYFLLVNKVKGSTVVLNENSFGFVSSTVGSYQQIVIPLSLFAANGLSVDRFRIAVAGSGTNLGLYLDDITLQGGIPSAGAPNSMEWHGVWSASTAYAPNHVVTYASATWVCLVANTNSAPAPANANWAKVASNDATGAFGAVFDGGGVAVPAGTISYTRVPYACTITGWSIIADAGTTTIDVWKIASGAALPTNANTITAAAEPALAVGNAIRSTAIPGWTTAVAANDIVGFHVDAAAGATWIEVMVICSK